MTPLNHSRARPTNDETCTAHHMLTGLRDNVNKRTNFNRSDHWTQSTDREANKALVTQIDKLSLAGHAVHQLSDGGYIVSKYGYSYYAEDFDALRAFALKLGVR